MERFAIDPVTAFSLLAQLSKDRRQSVSAVAVDSDRISTPVDTIDLDVAPGEFVVAWAIALLYSRRAGREFDQLAAQIAADFAQKT